MYLSCSRMLINPTLGAHVYCPSHTPHFVPSVPWTIFNQSHKCSLSFMHATISVESQVYCYHACRVHPQNPRFIVTTSVAVSNLLPYTSWLVVSTCYQNLFSVYILSHSSSACGHILSGLFNTAHLCWLFWPHFKKVGVSSSLSLQSAMPDFKASKHVIGFQCSVRHCTL